jgi:transposase
MAQTVCSFLSAGDRQRLAAILADRNRPQKHVARVRVILHSAERLGVAEVARRVGISRPAVWRWQQRFAEAGVDGLLRDKTRKPGKPPTAAGVVQRVVALTCAAPPGEATHWTGRMMARITGLSLRTVQRIWAAHELQPHRLRSFKRSRDPEFLAKLADIVGLYLAPPRHAVVLSVDEKSQIQALDRTQPGLPLKPGKAGTMTHDYVRHGTTTLFAALNVLDGTVLGRCPTGPDLAGPVANGTGSTAVPSMARHRHQEFIRFLNAVEAAVPAGKLVHCILDTDSVQPIRATHKHPKVRAWLDRHERWTFHYTPTSGSWLNAVESFFSAMTRRRLRRGVFHSLIDLQAAIHRYLAEHNADPKPFVWTATPEKIIAKLEHVNASVH